MKTLSEPQHVWRAACTGTLEPTSAVMHASIKLELTKVAVGGQSVVLWRESSAGL